MYTVTPKTNTSQEFTLRDPSAPARQVPSGEVGTGPLAGPAGSPSGGPLRRGRTGYGPGAPSPFPTSFPAVTWRGARGRDRAGAWRLKEGVRAGEGEGTQRVGGSAGRCGVTMTTGPEAACEVTRTRLAQSHVSGGGGAAPGPRP